MPPGGRTLFSAAQAERRSELSVGDALVLPAGTGHFRADAAANFQVCGAYPPGQENYDTLRLGDPRPPDLLARIARLPLPRTDPIYGADGPLTKVWKARDTAHLRRRVKARLATPPPPSAISPCSKSGAIVLHIAESHAGLPDDANARARAIMWMSPRGYCRAQHGGSRRPSI